MEGTNRVFNKSSSSSVSDVSYSSESEEERARFISAAREIIDERMNRLLDV